MKEIEEDQVVQITYNGKAEIQKGKWEGTQAHDIEVIPDEADISDDDEEIEEDEDEADDL